MTAVRRATLLATSSLTPQSKGVINGYILDDWDQIICNAKAGKAQEYYSQGDWKEIDFGTYGKNVVSLGGFNNEVGFALDKEKTSFPYVRWTTQYVLPDQVNIDSTGTTMWQNSGVKKFFTNTLYPSLPEFLKEAIVPVYVSIETSSYNSNTKKWTHVDRGYDQNYLVPSSPYKSYDTDRISSIYQEHFPINPLPSIANTSTSFGGYILVGMEYSSGSSSGTGFSCVSRNRSSSLTSSTANWSKNYAGGNLWISFSFFM